MQNIVVLDFQSTVPHKNANTTTSASAFKNLENLGLKAVLKVGNQGEISWTIDYSHIKITSN